MLHLLIIVHIDDFSNVGGCPAPRKKKKSYRVKLTEGYLEERKEGGIGWEGARIFMVGQAYPR